MRTAVIVVITVTAATLMVLGGSTVGWWTYHNGDMHSAIGLRGIEMCLSGDCSQASLERLERDWNWIRAGAAAYTAALLTGGLLLAVTGICVVGRKPNLSAKTALVSALCALVTGGWYVLATPELTGIRPGYSMLMFFLGAILAIVAAITSLRSQTAK